MWSAVAERSGDTALAGMMPAAPVPAASFSESQSGVVAAALQKEAPSFPVRVFPGSLALARGA